MLTDGSNHIHEDTQVNLFGVNAAKLLEEVEKLEQYKIFQIKSS